MKKEITRKRIKKDLNKIIDFFRLSEITDSSILNNNAKELFSFLKDDKKEGRALFFDNIQILNIEINEKKSFFLKIFSMYNKFLGYDIKIKCKLQQYYILNGEFDKTWGSNNQSVAKVYDQNKWQMEKDKAEIIDVIFKISYDDNLLIDSVEFIDNTRWNVIFP